MNRPSKAHNGGRTKTAIGLQTSNKCARLKHKLWTWTLSGIVLVSLCIYTIDMTLSYWIVWCFSVISYTLLLDFAFYNLYLAKDSELRPFKVHVYIHRRFFIWKLQVLEQQDCWKFNICSQSGLPLCHTTVSARHQQQQDQ